MKTRLSQKLPEILDMAVKKKRTFWDVQEQWGLSVPKGRVKWSEIEERRILNKMEKREMMEVGDSDG